MTGEIKGSCHCRTLQYTVHTPGALPIPGTYSHSTDLRLVTGVPCIIYGDVPSEPTLTGSIPDKVGSYTAPGSEYGGIEAVFCTVCGATLYLRSLNEGKASLLVGCIDLPEGARGLRDVVVPTRHVALGETFMGGIEAVFDDGLPRFHDRDGEVVWTTSGVEGDPNPGTMKGGKRDGLEGGCHCGEVRFSIAPPPDGWEDDEVLREWVKPGGKYCAGFCVCHTCRKVSGSPIWTWTFIPTKQIRFVSDHTLRVYESSCDAEGKARMRRFCGRCGCHLFYEAPVVKGEMWDVALGVLDQRRLREEGWFSWKFEGGGREAVVDEYCHGWKVGEMSFEGDGREFCVEFVEELRRGRGKGAAWCA